MRGIYSEETLRNRSRRYRRMETKLIGLRNEKKISTVSPKSMTADDVRVYLMKEKGRTSPSDFRHDINAMRRLFAFAGNEEAVSTCLARNPGIAPVVRSQRIPSMDDSIYDRILARSKQIDPMDFSLLRGYTLTLLCLRTGARNKEVRFANVGDIDTKTWIFDIIHVKGEKTYGQARQVPIHPEIRPLVLTYLLARQKWLVDNNLDSPVLFPSKSNGGGYLSSNSMTMIKNKVEDDLGIRFDLRTCRRTFGQKYMDSGLDLESTSVLMGHSSTKTTEGYYCRRKLTKAIESAESTWPKTVSEPVKSEEGGGN